MDITPCDITCITGVISNTVILHMAVMIRLYATILPFPVILRRRIKPEAAVPIKKKETGAAGVGQRPERDEKGK